MLIFEFVEGWSISLFFFYFIIAILFTYLCSLGINGRGKHNNISFFFAFLLLWFFQAFRSISVGVDTEDYVYYFYDMCKYGWTATESYASREPLYNIYVYLISRVSHSYTALFAINALITNGALVIFVKHFFKKGDSYTMLPLFLLNYIYDMSAMRSSLAVAFVLVSFIFLDKQKFIYSIIFSIVAVLFHATTIIVLLIIVYRMFLLWNNDRTKGFLILGSALSLALMINFFILNLQSILMETQYAGYADELNSGWSGIWNLALSFIISIILIIRNRRKRQLFNTFDIVNVVVFAICPVIVQLGAYRLVKYFLMFRILTYKTYFTELESRQKDNYDKNIIKIVEIIIMLLCMLFYVGRMGAFLPYEFAPIF